jgi:hypothetical protein
MLILPQGTGIQSSHHVVRFGSLLMWAERGLIRIEDSNTGQYEIIGVRECLQRMKAIMDMLGNSTQRDAHSASQFDRAFRARNVEMLEGMTKVVKIAQEQGMPTDAGARRAYVRARPRTFVVPTIGGTM